MNMAAAVYRIFHGKVIGILLRPAVNQVIRSSSSVAANYRAAARARSDAEYYAKICIVVEECDETQFWFDYLIRIKVLDFQNYGKEYDEIVGLLKIFTSIKKKMRDKLDSKTVKR
jgi:four helix bundle protein